MIQYRLTKIRQRMKEENIDAYLVLSSDYHESEYTSDFFKCREFLTGFTGSAGDVVILPTESALWTDGRYYLQAEIELSGSGISLFRIGEEGVEELEQYLFNHLYPGAVLGVDGKTICIGKYLELKKLLQKKQISIRTDCDLVGDIWENRPKMSCQPVWKLELQYTGKSRKEKLMDVRKQLIENEADMTFISSLEDIAWILNIRGNDILCTPVVLGYLAIHMEYAIWFVQLEAIDVLLRQELQLDGVYIKNYRDAYSFFSDEFVNQTLYLDFYRTNTVIYKNAKRFMHIKKGRNLTMLPKAIKNQIEINNEQKAHIKDAIACIKFIYWLKTHVLYEPITEISSAIKLEEYRQEQEHYLGPSFDTIVGYAQHGAIVHYSATQQTNVLLKPENFVLIDSGGHYLEGTTDITRTIALGTLSQKQKYHYTLVLKGHIRLATAKFRYGCAGINLDYLAREALWELGLDYNHGTGHGVGYLLGVHEPPNCFRSHVSNNMDECIKLEPGMITSNEPGLYLPGEYGIRIENLMLCKEIERSKYGKFLGFDILTLVPFEKDAILAGELTYKERNWINEYHSKVYKTIGPYLNNEEKIWLKTATTMI